VCRTTFVVHDRQPVGQFLGLLEVVRGQDDRGPRGNDVADQTPGVTAALGVQAGGGFVEEEHIRAIHERQREIKPTTLATGQALDPDRRPLSQVDHLQRLAYRAWPGQGARPHPGCLSNGQVGGEAPLLQHDANPQTDLPPIGNGIKTENRDLASCGSGRATDVWVGDLHDSIVGGDGRRVRCVPSPLLVRPARLGHDRCHGRGPLLAGRRAARRRRVLQMGQHSPQFGSVADVAQRLAAAGYLADAAIATTVFLADRLAKPLLVEGPAGVGKTELAKALATATDAELIRLQCYEGLDEARALYEWNYKKQLLRIQVSTGSATGESWDEVHDDIFTEEFLLARPLLAAIRRTGPTVLLIDETDKADVEVEGLLLEVLSDFQVTVPELGTIVASRRPIVVLTSNATRELSEALKRRCLYLALDYPSAEREREIVQAKVPDLAPKLAEQLVGTVRALRALELKKSPSIAETLDWAHTLLALGLTTLDEAAVKSTLGVVLKHASDQERAATELRLN